MFASGFINQIHNPYVRIVLTALYCLNFVVVTMLSVEAMRRFLLAASKKARRVIVMGAVAGWGMAGFGIAKLVWDIYNPGVQFPLLWTLIVVGVSQPLMTICLFILIEPGNPKKGPNGGG